MHVSGTRNIFSFPNMKEFHVETTRKYRSISPTVEPHGEQSKQHLKKLYGWLLMLSLDVSRMVYFVESSNTNLLQIPNEDAKYNPLFCKYVEQVLIPQHTHTEMYFRSMSYFQQYHIRFPILYSQYYFAQYKYVV